MVDQSIIRQKCREDGKPIVDAIVEVIRRRSDEKSTLFAVCPNSESVTRAALQAGKKAGAPVIYAATLNQVDDDRGYTGWTQAEFVDFITKEAGRIGFDGPVIPCLDHGGPWLKDKHSSEGFSYQATVTALKNSLVSCVKAGYDLLHIDPTVDKTLKSGATLSIDVVVQRTVECIDHVEKFRRENKLPRISYEVGTEEVHGGLADKKVFIRFLEQLKAGLSAKGYAEVWPCFIVGKVGTDLHTTLFDPQVARELAQLAAPYGSVIKGHYTDYVENPEKYPESGMGAANIGPEFTEEEYKALMHLIQLEKGKAKDSGLKEALANAVNASGRWKKWLQPDEKGKGLNQLSEERQEWLIRTGSRYIWTDANVVKCRRNLYQNLKDTLDADQFVLDAILKPMMKYYGSFNLMGINKFLEKAL